MTTAYIRRDPDDWTETIPVRWVVFYLSNRQAFEKALDWYVRHLPSGRGLMTSYSILSDMRTYMPRKGKSNGNSERPGTNGNRPQVQQSEWHWYNQPLTDDDSYALEQSQESLQYLATYLLGLGDEGFGVKVVPQDDGKSICCTIYRPDDGNPGHIYGLSGFGGTVRDACLVAVYKYTVLCEGDFSTLVEQCASGKQSRRFR